ncbi:hypothetical protein OY671_010543, partial [Metschnikowia pulcherrima]
ARKRRKPGKHTPRAPARAPSPASSSPEVAEQDAAHLPRRRLWIAMAVAAAAVFAFGGVLQFLNQGGSASQAQHSSVAGFVGSATCAGCHQAEAKLWDASQHKAAMAHATDKTVLGNFNDASYDYYGVRSRFFRKDGKFSVETDGPDGKFATFEVKYTFGIDPLQQYLVEFPDGR